METAQKAPTVGAPALEAVQIKQEKLDQEVEAKINAISIGNAAVKNELVATVKHENKTHLRSQTNNGADEDSADDEECDENVESVDGDGEGDGDGDGDDDESNDTHEDKKSIEPVKSSNEILAELFRVFNAAPPEELLDDKSLLKKSHKHKKHKKEKKQKKVKREKEKSEGERSATDSSLSKLDSGGKEKKYKHKHKKKKKHKKKHKDDKNAEVDKEKDKSKNHQRSKKNSIDKEKERERRKTPKRSYSVVKVEHVEDSSRISGTRKRHAKNDVLEASSNKKSCNDRERSREKKKDQDQEREQEREKEKEREHNNFYNGYREREVCKAGSKIKIDLKATKRSKEQRNNKDGHISEISLSDEETYLKERESVLVNGSANGAGDCKRRRSGYDKEQPRVHNSFYAGVERSRSREHEKVRERERNREWDRDWDHNRYRGGGQLRGKSNRTRSRSRSRSRSHDLGIDKKRLLEIARKNAISMFKRGNLPGCADMSQEVKDKVLLKMRYGGRTVQDLTDFCKKISKGENLSDLSSDEDSDVDKNGNTKAFHHPFQLKERDPIVMHISNATPLAPRKSTAEQTKAITMQFPVSSGQQHRLTEAWTPVESKNALEPLPTLPAATQSTSIFKGSAAESASTLKNITRNVFEKPMPLQQVQEPAFKPVMQVTANSTNEPLTAASQAPVLPIAPPPTVVPSAGPTQKPTSTPVSVSLPVPVPPPFVPDVPVPSTTPANNKLSVFPQLNAPQLDVSSIISKRLNAMRRLQENPMDPEALKMMYNSQKEMSSWGASKQLPGQFTGSTGVNVLKVHELNSGPQAWARRDQLTSTQPMTGGMGMQLLQKMGWRPGEGLGREKTGSLQPLLLDVKLDKRGLVAKEDNNYSRRQPVAKKRPNNIAQAQQQLTDKHPVCLLNELTSKRKWTPPLYTLINDMGPSHNKLFMFSVQINGQTYTPDRACNTKKEAKMLAAKHCLQQIGILPP